MNRLSDADRQAAVAVIRAVLAEVEEGRLEGVAIATGLAGALTALEAETFSSEKDKTTHSSL